jgi:hypothetical protein
MGSSLGFGQLYDRQTAKSLDIHNRSQLQQAYPGNRHPIVTDSAHCHHASKTQSHIKMTGFRHFICYFFAISSAILLSSN